MFTFRCSSCGKHHVLPAPPAQDYNTTCLRCERSIHIPGQGVTARPGMGMGRSNDTSMSVAGGMASPAGRASAGRAIGAQPGGAGSSYNPDDSRVSGLIEVPRSAPVLCPGCGTHLSDSLPLEDMEMSCPECGQLMLVPGSHGESSAPASARRATPGRAASEPASLDDDLDASDLGDDDSDDGDGLLSQAITRPGKKASKRPGKAASTGGGKEAAARKAARKKAAYQLAQEADDLDNEDMELGGAEDEELGEEPFADDPEQPQPELEGEQAAAGQKSWWQRLQGAPGEKPWWQRWQVIAGAAVVLVLLGSIGSYFALKKKTPAKKPPVAQRTTPHPQPAPPPPPEDDKPKPKPPPPVVKPKIEPVGWLAAARLGAEYSANPEATDARYKDQYLEVSGLVDKVDKKPGAAPPKKGAAPVAEFEALLKGGPISIRVNLPADFRAASRQYGGVEPEKVVTVRGVYSGRCTLQNCEVRPPTAPADAKYKGRLVEVSGHVASVSSTDTPGQAQGKGEYPLVTLQGPTDAIAEIGCYFRLGDQEEIRKLKPNAPVVIQGRCAGRMPGAGVDNKVQVRLDNCELVYSSAPTGQQVARLPVGQFLREYEEDIRPVLAPLPEPGNRVDAKVSVRQLSKEMAADPAKAAARYQNKVLLVSGSLWEKHMAQARLVLFTDQTDINLKVRCQFTKYAITQMAEELNYKGQDYEVRGMCTLVDPKKGVTLENCSFLEDDRKGPRLTADFLPHTPGESLTYDSAAYPLVSKPRRGGQTVRENPVTREAHYQRADGLTEVVKTYVGLMPHESLFEEGNTGKWINHPKKARKLRLPGGTYLHRLSANFVEIGTPMPPAKEGEQPTMLWEPLVRLGAHQGDRWKWVQPNGMVNTYTLVEFGEYEDHRAAIIQVETSFQGETKFQVVHILAEGVGEVARKNMVPITSKDSKVIGEMKLVEENNKMQKLPLLGPLFKGFTPSNEKAPSSGKSDASATDGPPSTGGKKPPATGAPDSTREGAGSAKEKSASTRDKPSQPDPASKDRAKPPSP